jgi:T-complex protein 1 subunit gamma
LTLQAKHANGEHQFGVDGDTGKVTDMNTYGLLESASVKIQTLKTAIEVSDSRKNHGSDFLPTLPLQSAKLLLRVDDIVSARRKFSNPTVIESPARILIRCFLSFRS